MTTNKIWVNQKFESHDFATSTTKHVSKRVSLLFPSYMVQLYIYNFKACVLLNHVTAPNVIWPQKEIWILPFTYLGFFFFFPTLPINIFLGNHKYMRQISCLPTIYAERCQWIYHMVKLNIHPEVTVYSLIAHTKYVGRKKKTDKNLSAFSVNCSGSWQRAILSVNRIHDIWLRPQWPQIGLRCAPSVQC